MAASKGVLMLIAFAAVVHGDDLDIQLTSGKIRGVKTDASRKWLGIPYANPPVGNLRWQNPEAASSWSDIKQTTEFGAGCPQKCNLPPGACQEKLSEDCLYLNVFTPLAPTSQASVLVFFHGGRFEQGSEGVELYDGTNIANLTNTIVVTVNYRLGVLGFLTLPNGFIGNYGMRDQRLSLEWVRSNIAQFGGDPNRVTIFGQSAGGTSVSFHLTSKPSFGLFQQIIVESSPFSLPLLTTQNAYKHYDHFAKEAGCDLATTECLLNLTADQVVDAQIAAQQKLYLDRPLVMFFPWTPVVDGVELTDDPLTLVQTGEYAKVPMIIGNVGQEAWLFVYEAFPALNRDEAIALVYAIFRDKGEPADLISLYDLPDNVTDYRPWISGLASDFIMRCTARNVSSVLARDNVPVFRYEFNHSWSILNGWGPNYPFCEGRCCHGVELPFVFDSAGLLGYNFSVAEFVLSKQMASAWGTFAVTGSPNGAGFPTWPQANAESDQVLYMRTEDSYVVSHYRKNFCDFWDQFGYIF